MQCCTDSDLLKLSTCAILEKLPRIATLPDHDYFDCSTGSN